MEAAVPARWRMLVPVLTLAVGVAVVLAMAYLEHSQARTADRSLDRVRAFRLARVDLQGAVLRMGWAAAAQDGSRVAAERGALQDAMARLEASLNQFDATPPALMDPVRAQIAAVRAEVNAAAATPVPGVEGYPALDQAMTRLDNYNAGAVRALIAGQRQQFALAVVAALALLAGLGVMVWRTLQRLERAELGLRESESQLRQMVELMPQLVFRTDAQGQCDYLSSRWADYTGVALERHLGTAWLEVVHPDDRGGVAAQWAAILATGDTLQAEFRLRRHDGVYRWFDVRAGRVRSVGGRTLKWFGSCTDITERKAYEAELVQHRDALEAEVSQRTSALVHALKERDAAQQGLEASNAQLRDAELFVRLVADNIPGRIAYWDKDRNCRFVNRAYSAWYGFAHGDLIGRNMRDVRSPAYLEKSEPRVARALAGELQDFEREEIGADGAQTVSHVQYLPHVDGGEVQGFFVLSIDITARQQARQLLELSNAQLSEARDRADSANRAKSMFLSNMSHEIRTPMNAILGLTHLLRRDIQDPAHQERLGKVWNAAHHLLEIVNDILDLSKIEAGKLTLERIDFSLDALLTRTCSLVVDAAREKGLEVVLDTGGLPDRLNGDPTRLMQALLNLLSNAVKFTERGSVLLHGQLLSQEAGQLEILFEVRDTGIGIPPEVLARLFTPFSQADGSSTRRQGGTGLGLAITRHIAELMGGTAGADSEPGRGSRFWIQVVLRPALQPLAATMPVLDQLHCLLVDDLLEAREALAEMLRALGMRVDTAANGAGALTLAEAAAARGDPYALLLLDWAMPGMTGVEAGRRLASRLSPPPPMILVSAYDQDDLSQIARDAGFAAVLLKPVTPSLLLDSLMRALKGQAVAPPAQRSVEALEDVVREQHRGARVLLAEDNPVNQEVAAELLQAAGLVVDIAHHGEEAVRMTRHGRYDIILMDVQMPYLDGLQAVRLIRQDPRLAGTPVIAMTANALAEDRQSCLEAGMNDHLAKPIDPRRMYEALLQWLPARQRIAQAGVSGALPAAAAAPSLEIEGLDRDALYEQCAGRTDLAVRVLRQFMEHYGGASERIWMQMQDGLVDELQRTLHSLRGASSAIGAVAVNASVRALEAAIKAAAPREELLARARPVCDALQSLVDALRAQLGPEAQGSTRSNR